jgi:hypothetical protein
MSSLRQQALAQAKVQFHGCKTIDALLKRYFRKTRKVHWGRNRITFEFPSFVVKLPITLNGITDNDWEGSISNNPNAEPCDWQVQYARTRLYYKGDIPIILMEKVKHATRAALIKRFGKEPKWVACVDCGQVGFNKQGRLVAYDYGIR